MAVLKGEKVLAKQKYDAAITTSARAGFIHDRALANERAGEYMLESGDKYLAFHYLSSAIQFYSKWGAKAKVEHLLYKHQNLLSEYPTSVIDKRIERRQTWIISNRRGSFIRLN
eukprot:428772-Ditylum_brightwellii.AAC.1